MMNSPLGLKYAWGRIPTFNYTAPDEYNNSLFSLHPSPEDDLLIFPGQVNPPRPAPDVQEHGIYLRFD
ncbi:MAG: hypothetical protein DSY58_07230 [Desulfobulbus sp.]|nr:MAG: hypothetical protein DSY58_07230 [Desulfobulbus sp.]